MTTLTRLNTQITYRDGHIDVIDSLDESLVVEGAEVVETGCRGWGESNAVVRYDGNHYLATIVATDLHTYAESEIAAAE